MIDGVKWVKSYCDDVEFFFEDVVCIEYDFFCWVVEVVIDVGVIIVNIFDMVGYVVFE